MTDTERTFSETEHLALVTDAVTRETAELRTSIETSEATVASLTAEKAELQTQLDVAEAATAAGEKARDDIAAEFEAYKTDLEEKAAVEERKSARVAAVKEAASDLDDTYFTDDRAQRWAEMSDDSFAALIADLVEASAARKPKADDNDADDMNGKKAAPFEKSRETAAFSGGTSPTETAAGSLFGRYLSTTGRGPDSKS